MMYYLHAYIFVFLTFVLGTSVAAETFTPEEQTALEKFRPLIDSILYRDFMKKDEYLIRWLRARNLDVNDAKTMLEKHIAWRKAERMDEALTDDHTKVEKCVKITKTGYDRRGRPVVYAFVGRWDIRRCALAGLMPQMNRYVMTFVFESIQQDLESSIDPTGGGNVTQGYFISDLHGFNARQGACLACLPIYVTVTTGLESNYPGLFYKLMLINAPRAFNPIVSIFQPILSTQHKDLLKVLGHGKNEWGPTLARDIAPDQLLTAYGGQKQLSSLPKE